MVAQRTRHAVIAANIANANVLYNAEGEFDPYLRRSANFSAGDPSASSADGRSMGVHVIDIALDENALRPRWEPDNPNADADGYIMVPDINTTVEQINAMEASRAYEANVAAAEATKTMMSQALRMLA